MTVTASPRPVVRAELARGLSDVSRQRILEALRNGERRVADLVDDTRLSQPNVSKHLRCLRGCGLVASDKRGRETFYAITPNVLEVLDVLDAAAEHLAPQMAACPLTADTVDCCS